METKTEMVWSRYQEDIFDEVEEGTSHMVVDAVPGSGKTTTLIEVARRLDGMGNVLLLAFNRHIADELNGKIGSANRQARAKTVHSVCYGTLAKGLGMSLDVQTSKYSNLCKAWITENANSRVVEREPMGPIAARILSDSIGGFELGHGYATNTIEEVIPYNIRSELKTAMKHILNLIRLNLIEPDDRDGIQAIIDKHGLAEGLEEIELIIPGIPIVLQRGIDMAEQFGIVDFTDMLYLVVKRGYRPYRNQFVLVDEAQDLSPAQLELVMMCVAKRGKLVFVGDKRQAIYG